MNLTRKVGLFQVGFLIAEAILYYFILTATGELLAACCFSAIAVCFLFALLHVRKDNALKVAALGCTLVADFFLVVCSPAQQLWGMVFFLAAQIFYAIWLHLSSRKKLFLVLRGLLIVAIEVVAALVLGGKLDALVIVSVCYYANLIVSIIEAFSTFKSNRLFAIGLVLFILCDTVVGLQAAAGVYLPIAESSALHKILFMDFFLSWFFYLPSQVLIALSTTKKPE